LFLLIFCLIESNHFNFLLGSECGESPKVAVACQSGTTLYTFQTNRIGNFKE